MSRLNGGLEFLGIGDRLSLGKVLNESDRLPSMQRRKTHSNHSSLKTVTNSVSNDQFPYHTCRAHRKIISVLEICKDLVITGSYDNLLKVMLNFTTLKQIGLPQLPAF